ncbi:MAG: hypothetical protein IJB34_05685 [Clostridia bacterium]|nr:hypothetical protein [Clostridia bacterium]
MSKYYSEEIVKNTPERKEYLDTLCAFLDREKEVAKEKRGAFISPAQYKENPEFYREKYKEMLGFPLTEKQQTPVCIEKKFVARDLNVNIYRMRFEFPFGVKTYGMYFEQTENAKNAPFVLGLHGGGGTPELVSSLHMDSANYNHLVRRITDRGANVFAPQTLLWNEEIYGQGFNRGHIDGKLRQLGGSITALELYLMRGCVNWFFENEGLCEDKFGVAGLSYGGMYTLHYTALDTRVKAAYSCSFVHDGFTTSWEDWSYKNAQNSFTNTEVVALVAPRALAVAMGDKDELFDSNETFAVCEEARKYYKEYGAEDKLLCRVFDGNHETDRSDEEIDFLLANLL